MTQVFQALILGSLLSRGGQTLTNLAAEPCQADLLAVKELIEAGKVKPVIDRCYPLSEIGEAIRHYGGGHARGKVVITVQQNGDSPERS